MAYKYKELLINKKIKRFLPRKPKSPFTIFLRHTAGVKVPEDTKPMNFFHDMYNNLPTEKKEKFDNIFKKELEDYNKKLSMLNNKNFQLPPKPKSGLSFFLSERFKEYKNNDMNLDPNKYINLVFEEWFNDKIDKKKYEELAKKDKKRFEIQMNEFEKNGYYTKAYQEDYDSYSSSSSSSSSSSYISSDES